MKKQVDELIVNNETVACPFCDGTLWHFIVYERDEPQWNPAYACDNCGASTSSLDFAHTTGICGADCRKNHAKPLNAMTYVTIETALSVFEEGTVGGTLSSLSGIAKLLVRENELAPNDAMRIVEEQIRQRLRKQKLELWTLRQTRDSDVRTLHETLSRLISELTSLQRKVVI